MGGVRRWGRGCSEIRRRVGNSTCRWAAVIRAMLGRAQRQSCDVLCALTRAEFQLARRSTIGLLGAKIPWADGRGRGQGLSSAVEGSRVKALLCVPPNLGHEGRRSEAGHHQGGYPARKEFDDDEPGVGELGMIVGADCGHGKDLWTPLPPPHTN